MYNHQLDAFVKVAELGSFNKAAEAMYISSTAVIQQINLLEGRYGFSLFERSHRGAKLTAAGASLFEDAKTIIRLSENALSKADQLAESSEHTVRIGTSLLYKCRLLTDIWSKISEQCPDLKIEIVPKTERQSRESSFSALGSQYDLLEGIYGSIAWKGKCRFLELIQTPICCAVAKTHRLAALKKITMQDLNGEYLVMPVTGVSREMDNFRSKIESSYPTTQIIDSYHYGVDTFVLCEVNPYVLITQQIYADIHTNLVTIPLSEEYFMPYGLIYATDPTPAVKKFIQVAKNLCDPI